METKKLILLIDDEVDFVVTMRAFLENSGFRVIPAISAEEGLEKSRLNPDLILLDLNMPGMNGHEICMRLKEDLATMHIPVVMLTSADKTIDKVQAFNIGVADYICKTFPIEEILARIKAKIHLRNQVSTQDKNKETLELRKIIDEKNIRTLFQPIVTLATKLPIGYEALTRGPKGSTLESPIDLFTVAVDENMFTELEKLTLGMSIKKAHFISKDQILFLNVHPNFIETEHFRYLDFLKDSAIKLPQICIELTERSCIKNFSKMSSILNDFRKMGVKLAVDDVRRRLLKPQGYSGTQAPIY